jgi:predicted MFS family arabinose efflux permease
MPATPHSFVIDHAGSGALGEWRGNWTVVMATMFGAGVATFHLQSLGPMIKPLGSAFGWSRTEVAAALMIVSISSIAMNPVMGHLMDRFGARKVALRGLWAFAGAIALLGATGPRIWSWYAAYTLVAVISPSVTSLIWSRAIVERFDRSRGLALGAMRSGLAILGGCVPLFMVFATAQFGWRGAYVALGVMVLLIAFPMALFFFHDQVRPIRPAEAPPVPGVSARQALRDRRFWQLSAALASSAVTTGFFTAHLQPLLTDDGLDAASAALLTGAIGPVAALSGLLYGRLADCFHPPHLTAMFFLIPIIGSVLVLASGISLAWGASVVLVLSIGASLGSEGDSIALLTGRFFGQRAFGVISGMVMSAFILGFGLGPLIGAALFDATGSYRSMMYLCIAMLAASALLVGTLGRFPERGATDLLANEGLSA